MLFPTRKQNEVQIVEIDADRLTSIYQFLTLPTQADRVLASEIDGDFGDVPRNGEMFVEEDQILQFVMATDDQMVRLE